MKKRGIFLALCCMAVMSAKAGEPEVYSVYDGDTTLTYYYDDQRSSHVGEGVVAELYVPGGSRYEGYCDQIKRAVIDPSMQYANLQSISAMFYGWNNKLSALQTIDGMANLVTDQVTDMQYVFAGCTALDSIDLSHFKTANVMYMQGMFWNCSALKKLDLSSFGTGKVQYMFNMFLGCTSLDSLDLTSFNTEAVIKMNSMFNECRSLRSINLSFFNTANVEDMNAMFQSCQALDTLDLSNFDTRKVTDMNTMFAYCSSLKSLDIRQFKPAESCDLGWMFFNCSSLTSIYCYEDWRNISNLRSDAMFFGCSAIIGGRGTTYNSSWRTHALAHVDGGSEDPGYFTTYELEEERTATAINEIVNNQSSNCKFIKDGQLFILRGDKTYTVTGQQVR